MTSLAQALEALKANITILDTPESAPVACPTCEGTGYIKFDVPIDDPRFGKMVRCPNPECPTVQSQRLEQARTVMATRSSWRPDYAEMTFESFEQMMGNSEQNWQGKRGAYALAKAFAVYNRPFDLNEAAQYAFNVNWRNAPKGTSNSAVFTGPVGVGKTGAAIAAANWLMLQGKIVIFIRTRDLIAHVQDSYGESRRDNPNAAPTDACLQIYMNVPYLILDEFELENYTRDRREIIEKIIRARGDRPEMLPTLITTNLTQEQLYDEDRWGQRIADIVAKYHWTTVSGTKLRQTKRVADGSW